jgi:hypothetical protein
MRGAFSGRGLIRGMAFGGRGVPPIRPSFFTAHLTKGHPSYTALSPKATLLIRALSPKTIPLIGPISPKATPLIIRPLSPKGYHSY